jgi:D-tyrosyl-tRNA(Tyr) deacylase
MKIIVQRVSQASCHVDKKLISSINEGYLLLVGFHTEDTIEHVQYLAKKVANLRIFEDENQKMNRSILDTGNSILSISQFTLYGDARKGNRPSFIEAMRPLQAQVLYQKFNQILREDYGIEVVEGVFGAMMEISLINSGPVTIVLEK